MTDALSENNRPEPTLHEMQVGLCRGRVRQGRAGRMYWQCDSCRISSGEHFASVEHAVAGEWLGRDFTAHASSVQAEIDARLRSAGRQMVEHGAAGA
jgi:hypothetical protein